MIPRMIRELGGTIDKIVNVMACSGSPQVQPPPFPQAAVVRRRVPIPDLGLAYLLAVLEPRGAYGEWEL